MDIQTKARIRGELLYLEENINLDRLLHEPQNSEAIRRRDLLRGRLNSRFTELGDGGHKIEPAIVPADVAAKPEAASTARPTKVNRIRVRNRRPEKAPAKKLTDRQSEVLRLYGECSGNMSEVARRMGITHPVAKQHYDAANKKFGGMLSDQAARTTRLAGDRHGQGVKGLPAQSRAKGVKVDD